MSIAISAAALTSTRSRRRSSAESLFPEDAASLVAAMAGVLLVQFLSSLLLIIGMDVQAQLIVKGLVVIGAVALYSLAERRS